MTVCYAALCAASPFGDCRRCRGFGFQLKYDRRGRPCRGKHCRRCDGIGKRIRLGRHLYNVAVRLRTGAR
ncbi:hypothetical protein [Kitasatospora sp. GAS1066B]